jgi:hypothetical protein
MTNKTPNAQEKVRQQNAFIVCRTTVTRNCGKRFYEHSVILICTTESDDFDADELPQDQTRWHAQILLPAPLLMQHPMINFHCHMRERALNNTVENNILSQPTCKGSTF